MIIHSIPVTINTQTLYFILEKPDSLLAWENYYTESPQIAELILGNKQAREIVGGTMGFNYLKAARRDGKEVYIAYIAKNPVNGNLCEQEINGFKKEWSSLIDNSTTVTHDDLVSKMLWMYKQNKSFIPSRYKNLGGAELRPDFEKHYQNIVMSVGVVTDLNSISSTHMGIFKNPLFFEDKNFSRLSLPLHSFAACWAYENGKKIQANKPINKMVSILEKCITHISEEDFETLKKKKLELPSKYISLDHTNNYPTSVFRLSDITHIFLQLNTDKFPKANTNNIESREQLTPKIVQLLNALCSNIEKEKSCYHYDEAIRIYSKLHHCIEQYKNEEIPLSVMKQEIKIILENETSGFKEAPNIFAAFANFLLSFLNLFIPVNSQFRMFRPVAYYGLKNIEEELNIEFSTNL